MPDCLTQFGRVQFVALLAVATLLCPASRLAADVVSVGAVAPVPPAAGGTSNSQLVVGAGSDETSNDIAGWVSVDSGTLLQYGSLVVGDNDGFFGQVDVSGNFLAGANTKLNLSALGGTSNPTVQIGNEGTGYLNVSGGSTMTITNQGGDMSIGFDTTSVGYATITDPFTILTVADFLFVGQSGIGSLKVLNGALVRTQSTNSSRSINIGTNADGVGSVVVDGFNSVLRAGSNLIVGNTIPGPPITYGQGTLQIRNGGIVDVDNTTIATTTVGRLGRIELDGGTLIGNTPVTGFGTTVDGYLGGSGLVRGTVAFGADSSIEANSGDVLRFDGDVENQGAVTINNAEVRFLAGFANNVQLGAIPPGRVSLENGGTVRFTETLINDGVISNAHGTTNIHGEITNNGTIFVARDTVTTFYNNVVTPASVTVLPGGNALFLTNLTFVGSSMLQLSVGSAALTESSSHVDVGGVATLGGTLEINFDGGYVPAVGQTFELITAGGVVGAFDDIRMPLMSNDLEFGVLYSPTSVMMEVKTASLPVVLPGDYNNDGFVNAADYTVWRDKLGSPISLPNDDTAGVGQDDYTRWKTHFGQVAGSGAGAIATGQLTTPEPSACLLALIGLSLLLNLRAFLPR
jgi:T5SS/PEP-CTERM-associated repeat protein